MYVGIANGDIAWAFTTLGSALPLMQAGRIRLIAVAADKRTRAQPAVPTLVEARGPDMHVGSWLAVMAPRGTPQEVVRKINADINRVLADPDVVAALDNFGFDAAPGTPEQFAEEIRADAKKYAELVKRTGASVDEAQAKSRGWRVFPCARNDRGNELVVEDPRLVLRVRADARAVATCGREHAS